MTAIHQAFLLLSVSTTLALGHTNTNWTYSDSKRWGSLHAICEVGIRQSPIFLEPTIAEFDQRLVDDPLRFDNYFPLGNKTRRFPGVLENDGHTVTWTLAADAINDTRLLPRLSGSGLNSWFILDHIAMHWGSAAAPCRRGTDHAVGDEYASYPVEIQFVHYNAIYKSYHDAAEKPRGLANVAFLVKPASSPNNKLNESHGNASTSDLSEIVAGFSSVAEEGSQRQIYLNLDKILPFSYWLNGRYNNSVVGNESNTTNSTLLNNHRYSNNSNNSNNTYGGYYRYSGSLTAPPCSETVTWTVYADPIYVDQAQINATLTSFYATMPVSSSSNSSVITEKLLIKNNFRPIQKRNFRRVATNLHQLATNNNCLALSAVKQQVVIIPLLLLTLLRFL